MKEYISGDTLFLWGKPYTLRLSEGGNYKVNMTEDEIILGVGENDSYNMRVKALNRFYKSELSAMIPILIVPCLKRTGVELKSWEIQNNSHSFWGVCWPKQKRIALNLHLAKMPLGWLEAVIIHELVHIRIPYHSQRFYDMCEKVFPDYVKMDAQLNMRSEYYM